MQAGTPAGGMRAGTLQADLGMQAGTPQVACRLTLACTQAPRRLTLASYMTPSAAAAWIQPGAPAKCSGLGPERLPCGSASTPDKTPPAAPRPSVRCRVRPGCIPGCGRPPALAHTKDLSSFPASLPPHLHTCAQRRAAVTGPASVSPHMRTKGLPSPPECIPPHISPHPALHLDCQIHLPSMQWWEDGSFLNGSLQWWEDESFLQCWEEESLQWWEDEGMQWWEDGSFLHATMGDVRHSLRHFGPWGGMQA
eukprot:365771-Chlamydomonas_euryale.AAC.13